MKELLATKPEKVKEIIKLSEKKGQITINDYNKVMNKKDEGIQISLNDQRLYFN